MKWFVCLLLMGSCFAQTTDFAPTLVDSFPESGTSQTLWDTPQSGQLIVDCEGWSDTNSATPTIADTLGNTWTPTSICTDNDGSISAGHVASGQCWFTVNGTSGTDVVTVSGLSVTHAVNSHAVFKNITGTLDGSVQCATTHTSAGSISTSNTTAVNGSELVSFVTCASQNINLYFPSALENFAAGTGGVLGTLIGNRLGGNAGSQSTTVNANAQAPCGVYTMITMAFRPSAITITTSALADGAQTTAYKACLEEVGAVGAVTWSATAGLPAWATVNSTDAACGNGGSITGTPNASATSSITIQATDGTHTTTRTLSLKTGAAFATPNFVQYATGVGGAPATFGFVGLGDTLEIRALSFGAFGGVAPTSGVSNGWTDSLGTVFRRVDNVIAAPGDNNPNTGAGVATFIGTTTNCGGDAVNLTAGSNIPPNFGWDFVVIDRTGVQAVTDPTAQFLQSGFASGSISSTTGNYTAQVANEVLSVAASNGSGNTITINSPFTTIVPWFSPFHLVNLINAQDPVTTATTYTASGSYTSGNPSDDVFAMSLIGLRPALPPGSSCTALTGEKIRRQPN